MQNIGTNEYNANVGRFVVRQMADREQAGIRLHEDSKKILDKCWEIWDKIDEIIEKLARIEEILRNEKSEE